MALTDLTRISTSGIATGTSLSGAILHGDAHFRGTQVGVTSALFDSSDNALEFNDNVKIKLGNGGDLELYHTGARSEIVNNTGDLIIQPGASSNLFLRSQTGAPHFKGAHAAQVEIYYNGNEKIRTTNDGAVVTGILTASSFSGGSGGVSAGVVTCTGLDVNGNGDISGNLVLGGDLTVNGTTTTLDTNLIGVDRVEVGANSNTVVGVAITQSGTADILRLYDGSTQKVTVDDEGNIGIGINSPSTKLQVHGGLIKISGHAYARVTVNDGANEAFFGFENQGPLLIGNANADAQIRVQGTNDIFFQTGNTVKRLTIKGNTGRIGIGTEDPQVMHHLYSASGGLYTRFEAPTGQVNFGNSNGAGVIHVTSTSQPLRFLVNGGNERARIASDGKFGIGDFTSGTAVSQALHVKGSEPKIFLEHTGGYDMTLTTSDGAGNNGITVSGGALSLAYDNKNIWMCRVGGYVAMGHMSPATRLDVKQNNGVAYNNRAQSVAYNAARFFNESGHVSGGTYTGFQFNLTGDSQNRICSIGMISEASNNRNSSLVFATDDNGNRTEKLRITSDGRLLMGVTASQQGDANLQVFRAATTSRITFGNINTSASGIAGIDFCPSNKVMGSRIECQASEDFSTTANRTADLVFFTRQDGSSTEKVRIKGSGHVQLPINGQQLTFGSSQQIKFYYESSEDRMYLQGDGAYGFAFRVNSGNAIEIDKTTRDVTMQGASGRNFLWDNSEPSLYLTDNGTNSARLKIGTGGDLQLYHDVSGTVNHIVAATNGEIKISGGVSFYDYTGVSKRAVIDSNGLRTGGVAAPTLPTTGVTPMIMRSATHFTKEIHRTISDYRSICDGVHSGYLLLVPAYPGSGTTAGKKFYGTITYDRGSTGSGNSTNVSTVHASTGYNDDQFYVENARNSQYAISAAKVTYDGTQYLALKFGSGGGGPVYGIHIDGLLRGQDSNFGRMVRQNEIDSVQNDYHGAIANHNAQYPICGVMVVDMDGSDMNDNSIRYMRGGTIHFEYSPAGTDCYDNGIFTAQVNGIYHVTCGFLTGNNVGRVEAAIQRKVTGGSWGTIVNLNGAGNFSNSHNGPTATAFVKMKAGWQLRFYRVSANQGVYGSSHANNYFGAVLMHGLMDSQV